MNQTLPFIGSNLFCPDCRRQLVSFNPDGTFNLAGLTTVQGSGEAELNEDGELMAPPEMVITGATCYLRRCRFKRWIRNHNPRRK